MPKTWDLLTSRLGGVGQGMELLISSPVTVTDAPADTWTTVTVPMGAAKMILKTIRVKAASSVSFEVEVRSPDNDIEYASLLATEELYDTCDIPYVCAGADLSVTVRILPKAASSFTVQLKALKCKD